MLNKNRLFILILFFAFIAINISSEVFAQNRNRNIPTLNMKLADFTLTSLTGEKVTLSDFVGKKNVVIATFRGYVGYW